MIESLMKFNHYRMRGHRINMELVDKNCPQCNAIKNQQHIITCPTTYNMIENMKEELTKKLNKVPTYNEDKVLITELVDEIEVFLRIGQANRTNQAIIGFDSLFQGFIIYNQNRIKVNSRFEDYNKIIINHYILYYKQCWDHRNIIANDKYKKAERIRTQYIEEFREAQRNLH